jgi:hypothetical protein
VVYIPELRMKDRAYGSCSEQNHICAMSFYECVLLPLGFAMQYRVSGLLTGRASDRDARGRKLVPDHCRLARQHGPRRFRCCPFDGFHRMRHRWDGKQLASRPANFQQRRYPQPREYPCCRQAERLSCRSWQAVLPVTARSNTTLYGADEVG